MASLEVGIVGLPNSGKTSLFNALTGSRAEITSYAAVQASANVGIAAVPDDRIEALAQAVAAKARVPATVQFSDVAGLVRGSGNRDGGLGGEYLGHLRATHALAHVVRVFDDEAVSHPDGRIDPVLDAEAVDFELLISDQVLVTRRRERTERAARVGEKSARDELGVLERLSAHLDQGLPARTLDVEIPEGLDRLWQVDFDQINASLLCHLCIARLGLPISSKRFHLAGSALEFGSRRSSVLGCEEWRVNLGLVHDQHLDREVNPVVFDKRVESL